MNILRSYKNFDLLPIALAEQCRQKRYVLLNEVAEAFRMDGGNAARGFASVCYELNGEPHSAAACAVDLLEVSDAPEYSFLRACLALRSRDFDTSREALQQFIETSKQEKTWTELGVLLKTLNLQLEKMEVSPNDYFAGVLLPEIIVVKAFSDKIDCRFTEQQIEEGVKAAEPLRRNTALIISCCSNLWEQQLLETLGDNGKNKISCQPQMPLSILLTRNDDAPSVEKIQKTLQESELRNPITDYDRNSIPGEDLWNITEDYSSVHLLGLAVLHRKSTGFPIRYIWSDFFNAVNSESIHNICRRNGIKEQKIGGSHA